MKELNWNDYVINKYGTKEWRSRKGLLHRKNGPAVEYANGVLIWFWNGLIHRNTDDPSVLCPWQEFHWYKNGLKHRENGLPASVYKNGFQEYWTNGVKQ